MNSVTALKRGIGAELYKFRRTFILWFLVLAPAFVPFINLMIFVKKGHELLGPDENPWYRLVQMSIDPGNFLFTFFVMIVALFVSSIEHNSNTWKLIYTQPLSRLVVYTSKVVVFLLMLLFSLLLFSLFSVLVGLFLRMTMPDLGFDQAFGMGLFFQLAIKVFLATLGYASLQFWMSQRWKTLLLPLGIGIGGWISFLILSRGWEYVEYHPYGFPMLGLGNYQDPAYEWLGELKFVYRSVGLAAVVFVLAGWDMVRKRIV